MSRLKSTRIKHYIVYVLIAKQKLVGGVLCYSGYRAGIQTWWTRLRLNPVIGRSELLAQKFPFLWTWWLKLALADGGPNEPKSIYIGSDICFKACENAIYLIGYF